jgi:hypothetical protein
MIPASETKPIIEVAVNGIANGQWLGTILIMVRLSVPHNQLAPGFGRSHRY